MKLLKPITLLTLLSFFILSCSKEKSIDTGGTGTPSTGGGGGGSSTDIKGTWKLISMTGSSAVKDSFDMAGFKYVGTSLYSYTSLSASGTYTITATDFIGKDVTYKANGRLIMDIYMDGQLLTHMDTITPFEIPLTNSASAYTKHGSDSLYFIGGGMFSMQGNDTTTVVPGGLKYKIEGNKMTLTMKQVSKETISENGVSIIRKMDASASVVLQRQ